MHYLALGAMALAILFALSGGPQRFPRNQPAPARQTTTQNAGVELKLQDGFLTAIQGGSDLVAWQLPDAKPYRIVTQGRPAILTTCNDSLEISTIVAAQVPVSFPNMLPILVEPPFAVLAEMAVADTTQNGKISLVNAKGRVVWDDPDGMLLLPGAGELQGQEYMFAVTPGSTPILPLGEHSELVFVDAQTVTELWRTHLGFSGTPVDVQLLAVAGNRGLLLLQYGYVSYGFTVLDLSSGEIMQSWQFTGQVATQMVYPGGFSRLAPFDLDGNVASLVVLNLNEAAQLWKIDLKNLTLEKSVSGPFSYNIDQNVLPPGGARTPGPGNPPFPQGILPTQAGGEWTIPALVDGDGRLFVVHGSEAMWLSYN